MSNTASTVAGTGSGRSPASTPASTPTTTAFALYTRGGKGTRWKLHGVYATHDAAWEATVSLPKDRPRVWITRATDAQAAALGGVESNCQSDSPVSPTF